MDGVKYISWMFWNSRGHASGRWSRMHTLEQGNDRKTLCGRNVPFAFNYDYSPDNDYCTICHKKEKENQQDKIVCIEYESDEMKCHLLMYQMKN